eukprot:5042244-Prymnesium_polylepis.1
MHGTKSFRLLWNRVPGWDPTAEAMIAEALRMVDKVQERERAADERARVCGLSVRNSASGR